ncbi:MAG: hypothetical protein F4X69_13900 [Gemmatimonadetes bacterium]|nr:hypothetical protein [Gemmatimonadota bacterium]
MYIHWAIGDDGWHRLSEISCRQGVGVYIIWEDTGQVLYAGSGQVGDCLIRHQLDSRFSGASVTWADFNSRWIYGVEAYLHEKLKPIHSQRNPAVPQVPVNLPW